MKKIPTIYTISFLAFIYAAAFQCVRLLGGATESRVTSSQLIWWLLLFMILDSAFIAMAAKKFQLSGRDIVKNFIFSIIAFIVFAEGTMWVGSLLT